MATCTSRPATAAAAATRSTPGDSSRPLLAKVLRIDIDVEAGADPPYGIPDDNPFLDHRRRPPEIWLTGLRNPWRIRFDRATGDLWIGDVGQNEREEIDVARAGVGGLDFGWNVMEGSACFRDRRQRLPDRRADPAGHGIRPRPGLLGDRWHRLPRRRRNRRCAAGTSSPTTARGRFWVLDPSRDDLRDTDLRGCDSERSISAIAEDAAGELFATDLSGGELLRVVVDGG